jgi:SAM-dependent methyltransferase
VAGRGRLSPAARIEGVADEAATRRQRAHQQNYETDTNLRRRGALLSYAVPSPTPQPSLVDLFDWAPDATVLDVGCGYGLWTAIAASRTPDGRVVGLDESVGMLTALRERTADVPVVRGDAHVLPLRTAAVDVVMSTWVLYHLHDKVAFLREVRRVLRPGGRFIAATNSSVTLPVVDDLIGQAVEETVGHPVGAWIESLDFTAENGKSTLAPHFGDVRVIVNDTDYEVPDASVLVDYARSLRDPIVAEVGADLVFDDLLARFVERIRAALSSGPIRFTRRVAFFVAS